MAKRNLKSALRKSVALLSSAAMLMSCGMTGAFTSGLTLTASADSSDKADSWEIRDEYGNNITTEKPVLHIDNSTLAGQSTTASIYVTLKSSSGTLNDPLHAWMASDSTRLKDMPEATCDLIDDTVPGQATYKITVYGRTEALKEVTDPLTNNKYKKMSYTPAEPGKTSMRFYSEAGNLSQDVEVVVHEPASNLTVTWGGSQDAFSITDYRWYNYDIGGKPAVQGHEYQMQASIVSAHDTKKYSLYQDKVEWMVFEGDDIYHLEPTDRAEVSQTGVFTAKEQGPVWVVAKFKKTDKSDFQVAMAKKAYENGDIDSMPDFDRDELAEISTDAPVYTDRPYAIGNKKRKVYMLDTNSVTGEILLDDNGDPAIRYDSNGKPMIKELDDSEEAVRDTYKLLGYDPDIATDSDIKGVMIGTPMVETAGDYAGMIPKYSPIYNVPKYMRVYITRENSADSIKFSQYPGDDDKKGQLEVNDIFQLEIDPTPTHPKTEAGWESSTGATDLFEWSSSDPSVVSVESVNGKTCYIKALKKGTAVITVKGEKIKQNSDGADERVHADYIVNVVTKATSISMNNSAATRVGVESEIQATLNPADADEEVEWESMDPSIVAVEAIPSEANSNIRKAKIKGVSLGTTRVRVKSELAEKYIEITVSDRNVSSNLTLFDENGEAINSNQTVFTNKDISFTGMLTTADGRESDDRIIYRIDDNEDDNVTIVTNENGKLKLHGVSEGDVTVVAESENSPLKESFILHVLRGCDTVTILKNNGETLGASKYVGVGGELPLTTDMRVAGGTTEQQHNHSDWIAGWTSSKPDVADVVMVPDENGEEVPTIFAKSNGTADITVTTASGVKSTIKINVFTTSNIFLGGTSEGYDGQAEIIINMNKELVGTKKLTATVLNQNNATVSNVDCEWLPYDPEYQDNDPGIAEIQSVGASATIQALDVGQTWIRVKSGTKTDHCRLLVYAPIDAAQNTEIVPYVYTPLIGEYEPHPILTLGGHTLIENQDYTVSYKNNKGVGKATMTVTGIGYYTGSKTISFEIQKRSLTSADIEIADIDRQECTGSAIKPEFTMFCDGAIMTEGRDYTLTYANNTKPGEATITVTGKGNYSDKITKTFEIYCDHKNLKDVKEVNRATFTETGLEIGTCAACGEKDVPRVIPLVPHSANPASMITFDKEEYGLNVGDTLKLEPTIIVPDPSQPATDPFRWESANPSIVNVDKDGNIKGMKKGKTTITIYGENEDVFASCEVAVLTKAESVVASPKPAETRVGVAIEIKSELIPTASTDEIIWESANTAIATVETKPGTDRAVVVTGVSEGTTVITARARYSDVKEEIPLTVGPRITAETIAISTTVGDDIVRVPNSTDYYTPVYVIFSNDDVTFDSALANYNGDAADDVTVWQITENDGNAITLPGTTPGADIVGNSLSIHGAALGTAKITAFPQENPSERTTFIVEVGTSCDNVTIYDEYGAAVTSKSIDVSDHLALTADLTTNDPNRPHEHDDSVRTWTSDDESIAAVDATGYVTAKKSGTCNITVTTLSGLKKTAKINVFTTANVYLTGGVEKPSNPDDPNDYPTSTIVMNKDYVGTKTLTASVIDDYKKSVSNVTCKWLSSDEKIATVNEKGVVTAHDVGEVVITVQSGTKSERCLMTITAPMTAMTAGDIPDCKYSPTAEKYEPEPVIMMGEKVLTKDVDYTIEYKNNTKVGTANITVTGNDYYTGTANISFLIVRRDVADEGVLMDELPTYKFTGKAITPKPHLSCDGVDLVEGTDYTLAYANNTEKGTAKLTISGKGNYAGTKEVEFEIADDGASTSVGLLGDIDNDAKITAADALKILRMSAKLDKYTDDQLVIADINGDKKILADDALEVLRYSAKLSKNEKILQPVG